MTPKQIPRLPLEGYIDITYRCNNNCRHCWLALSGDMAQKTKELTFKELRRIVSEARGLGCQGWVISGGEPMIRSDFYEILDLLTRKSITYTLNTNGTLITPSIARMLKRKGSKMVALYGATADVHDAITRNPGSFEKFMQGVSYLKEAGAGFTIQVIPMRRNWHQYAEMMDLAKSLSTSFRIGSSWLYLSASGSKKKNNEIANERLAPKAVIVLDPPNSGYESLFKDKTDCQDMSNMYSVDDHIFKNCILANNSFHIDPYGGMSFCSFIKDPNLRFDLKTGSVREAWEDFLPTLAEEFKAGEEYMQNCGSCEKRSHCYWCGAYAYLEHHRYSAPIKYLCEIAEERKRYKKEWVKTHQRFFQIAGITIQVDSDLPITKYTYLPKFKLFETTVPGEDRIHIRIHFEIPELQDKNIGREVYRKPPLAIYKYRDNWIYLGISTNPNDFTIHRVAVFNENHSRGEIYVDKPELYLKGQNESLTLFASDQVLLARILAERHGFSIHASGISIKGDGLLFVGASGAGKSTVANLLKNEGQILCDENIIVRRWTEGFRIHGTWSHGDVTDISNAEAPLKAIFFIEKSKKNQLEPITDKLEITKRLLPRLLKPLITSDWWEKNLNSIEKLVQEVPAFRMKFDTSGQIKESIYTWLRTH